MKRKLLSLLSILLVLSVLVVPASAVGSPFSDVSKNYWASSQIGKAYNLGIVSGYPDGTFRPGNSVTGAHLVAMFARRYCSSDINADAAHAAGITYGWYDGELYALRKNGYLDGIPSTAWDTAAPRELLVALLYNVAGRPSADTSMLASFTDRGDVASYAVPGFSWAVSNGIVSGTSTTTLSPRGTATRAQVAVIMIRYIEKFEGEVPEYVPDPEPTPGTESRNADGTTNAAYVNSISGVNKDAAYPTTGAASSPNANGFYTEADVDIEGCTLQYDAIPYIDAFLEQNGYGKTTWVVNDEAEEYTLMRAKEAYVNFAHKRPDNTDPIAAENLYKGNGGASGVINAWDKSAGHHGTMLGCDGNYTCVARYKTCWVLTIWVEGSKQLKNVVTLASNDYYRN